MDAAVAKQQALPAADRYAVRPSRLSALASLASKGTSPGLVGVLADRAKARTPSAPLGPTPAGQLSARAGQLQNTRGTASAVSAFQGQKEFPDRCGITIQSAPSSDSPSLHSRELQIVPASAPSARVATSLSATLPGRFLSGDIHQTPPPHLNALAPAGRLGMDPTAQDGKSCQTSHRLRAVPEEQDFGVDHILDTKTRVLSVQQGVNNNGASRTAGQQQQQQLRPCTNKQAQFRGRAFMQSPEKNAQATLVDNCDAILRSQPRANSERAAATWNKHLSGTLQPRPSRTSRSSGSMAALASPHSAVAHANSARKSTAVPQNSALFAGPLGSCNGNVPRCQSFPLPQGATVGGAPAGRIPAGRGPVTQPQPHSMQLPQTQSFQLAVKDSASVQHDSQLYQQSRKHPMMDPQGNEVPLSAQFRTASPFRGHEEVQIGPFSSSFHAGTGTLGTISSQSPLAQCGLQPASPLGQTWGSGSFLGKFGGKGLARPFSFDLGLATRMWGSQDPSEYVPEAEVSLETGTVALKDPHGFAFKPGHRFPFRAGDRSSRHHKTEPCDMWEPPPVQRDEPPPPPRVAPAARSAQSFNVSLTIEEDPVPLPLDLPRSGPLHASGCHMLQVQMSDSRWECLEFRSGDDLGSIGECFVRQHGLNAMIQPGLVAKMQQMEAASQLHDSVDIVDLI